MLRKFFNKLLFYYYLNKKNTVCVASVDGMGDYIYLFSLLKAFKLHHRIKTLCFIARTKHQALLAKAYEAVDKIIYLPKLPKNLRFYISQYHGEKFFIANFFQPEIYQHLEENATALDGLKFLLNIPQDTSPSVKVRFSDNMLKNEIEHELKKSYKKSKTVLISPKSQSSLGNIPDRFWIKLAEAIQKVGYTPVFNLPENKFYNFKTIFPTKEGIKYYAQYFGNCISVRSGLCDYIMATTDIKCIVVYPFLNEKDKKLSAIMKETWGNFKASVNNFIFNKWDLNKLGFSNVPQFLYDINKGGGEEDKIINQIIKIIVSK